MLDGLIRELLAWMSQINWQIVGGVAAVGSTLVAAYALLFQIRSLRRSLASSTYQQIVQMFDDFSRLLIEHPNLIEVIYGHEHKALSAQETDIANWAMGIRFNWFESVYVQSRNFKIIPTDLRNHWDNVLREELKSATLRDYWKKYSHWYYPPLRSHVKEELDRT